jgi:hypothetical protein
MRILLRIGSIIRSHPKVHARTPPGDAPASESLMRAWLRGCVRIYGFRSAVPDSHVPEKLRQHQCASGPASFPRLAEIAETAASAR